MTTLKKATILPGFTRFGQRWCWQGCAEQLGCVQGPRFKTCIMMQSSAPFYNSPVSLMSFQRVNMAVVAFCVFISWWVIFPISHFTQMKSLSTCSSSIVLTESQCAVCKYDLQLSGLLATNLMNQPCWGVPQGANRNITNSMLLFERHFKNSSRTFAAETKIGGEREPEQAWQRMELKSIQRKK